METELEKLVESGKLTSKGAEQLEKLKPGTFCLNKSWGFGRVTEWNLLLNQILSDFAGKKSHPMQVQYAAENLTSLSPEHFLVRKASDLVSIKKLATEDPVAVVRSIVESFSGQATVAQISEWLVGDVFTEAEWKRWWESTKKLLKASGAFSVPAKKTDLIQLRGEGVSHTDELIASFNKARQPKEQIAALEQIIKFHQQFKGSEKQLQLIVTSIENVAARNQKMHPGLAFELIIARDDLLERFPLLHTTHIGLTLSKLILDEEKRLMSILPELLGAILAALEREQHNAPGRGSKLHRALVEDRQLVGEIFANSDIGVARDTIRRLQLSPLFDELTKRSLLGRIVKVYPGLEGMITAAQAQEKAAPLIVSWSSLERRKGEYEALVKTKIPENTKEIAIARSYGDLSENFEFKAAKQMQSVLMRRK